MTGANLLSSTIYDESSVDDTNQFWVGMLIENRFYFLGDQF